MVLSHPPMTLARPSPCPDPRLPASTSAGSAAPGLLRVPTPCPGLSTSSSRPGPQQGFRGTGITRATTSGTASSVSPAAPTPTVPVARTVSAPSPSSSGGAAMAAAPTVAPGGGAAVTATDGARDDFALDQRPIILFDGVCNLCNGGVNFMLDNDSNGAFRLAALQSPAGRRLLARCGRSPGDISSIVLVERDRHYIRSEAILRIGARLRVPLPLLAAFGFPVPLPLRDAFYDAVANNRYSFFGRTDACRLRGAGTFANRFIVD